MKAAIGKSPGLAVVLIGKRRDSHTFILIKLKACVEVRIASWVGELPDDCTEDEVLDVVSSFNRNPSVHGIKHLDEEKIINFVSPEKDVDGFHPLNIGNLAMRGREPLIHPLGIIQRFSTVQPFTRVPEQITCEADIVVSDVRTPNIVREWRHKFAFYHLEIDYADCDLNGC
ncbi:unnamed protein product [Dovyalis caffra]|uniref:Tetrahydrofolate dehydrogenase/cyclohydrolase catalytic domain-containing protein n=1 Tax=Dovyalis caffra TaxID=77055 RepID=A0AAV1RHU6_9ROSI|nr:unnamed protein product [Dovyalis caffra]